MKGLGRERTILREGKKLMEGQVLSKIRSTRERRKEEAGGERLAWEPGSVAQEETACITLEELGRQTRERTTVRAISSGTTNCLKTEPSESSLPCFHSRECFPHL